MHHTQQPTVAPVHHSVSCMTRCRYHDVEWGRPVHDDNQLFELLVLEGAQVSAECVLCLTSGLLAGYGAFGTRY